jgi:glycosyltransferase involved in cell wall biosynthesis
MADRRPVEPATTSPGPTVSVVIPVFNEVKNLPELVDRVQAALTGHDFELVLVDDGSSDGSAKLIEGLASSRAWLQPVLLIRNYGQSTALQAGFDVARGGLVATLDGDLQNDPADIPALLQILREQPDVDLVSGWRKDRQDAAVSRKLPSRIANRLIARVTGIALKDNGCALKVYRREIIERLRIYGEQHRFIVALAVEAGARVMEIPVRHHPRTRGQSKYGLDRTVRVLLDLLWVRFSMRFLHRPLHAFGSIGAALALLGFAVLSWLTLDKLVFGEDIGQRPLLLLGLLLLLLGVQLVATGVLGELLTRVYHEPQGRRQYIARNLPSR